MKLPLTRLVRGVGYILVLGTAAVLVAPLVYGIAVLRPVTTQAPGVSGGRPVATASTGPASSAPVASGSSNPLDIAAGIQAFIDLHNRTYTWLATDPANTKMAGQFVFYVDGVGTFLPGGTATVAVHSAHDVQITYDGTGSIDAAAKMDLEFGRSITQGTPTPALIRLDAHIDTDHHTAEISFWAGGKQGTTVQDANGDHRSGATHYQLVATQPESPTDTANSIARLTKAQDWSGLYALCDTSYQTLVSRDQWLQEEPAAFTSWLAGASITDVTASAISTPNGDAGYWTAQFTLTLTASGAAGTKTRTSTVILIYEANGWHIATGTNAH